MAIEMATEQELEAILFYRGEATSISELAALLKIPLRDLETISRKLEISLSGRGLTLLRDGDRIALGTAPAAGPIIARLRTEELKKPLSPAALETLALACYRGPISKPEIDYIRGVNSAAILRNLMIRGFLEKETDANGRNLYGPTLELLGELGARRKEDLPEYGLVLKNLRRLETIEKERAEPIEAEQKI